MAQIHVKQVAKNVFDTYADLIDFSDVSGFDKTDEKFKDMIISRGLCAYALSFLSGATPDETAKSVVDGSDDNGIDAIFFDEKENCLYLCQAKYIKDGNGEPSAADIGVFLDGVTDIIDLKFENFNEKVKKRSEEIESYLEKPEIKAKLLLIYTGVNIADPGKKKVEKLVKKNNDIDDWISYEYVTLDKLHNWLVISKNKSINIDTMVLKDYGYMSTVAKSYYGRICAYDIGVLWKTYESQLFSENIRELLPKSVVNDGMMSTLKDNGQLFWYYNNGITMICDSVEKSKIGGADRGSGIFSVKNASIVNGAQTVGTIGKFYSKLSESEAEEKLKDVFVQIRIIQTLNENKEPVYDGFDRLITINTNMQNKIMPSDFASQTPLQKRLKTDLQCENITYQISRSENNIQDESHFTLDEAARARCNTKELKHSLIAHRGVNSHLFSNINSAEYAAVFNDSLSGIEVWNAVLMQRCIDSSLKKIRKERSVSKEVYVYGKDFLSFLFFQKNYPRGLNKNEVVHPDSEIVKNEIINISDKVIAACGTDIQITANLFKSQELLNKVHKRYLALMSAE